MLMTLQKALQAEGGRVRLLQCSKCVTDRQAGRDRFAQRKCHVGSCASFPLTVQNRPISLDTGGIEMMMKQLLVLVVKAHGALIK